MWSSQSEHHTRLRRRALTSPAAVAACSIAGFVLSSCVSGPLRTFRTGVEHSDSGGSRVTNQNTLVELGVQERIGSDVEYRLNDTYAQSTQWFGGTAGDTRDETTLHRPTLDIELESGPLTWTQTYRMQEDRSLIDSGADNRLLRKDVLQKVDWLPDELPQVTAWLAYRTVEDRYSVEQTRLESQLQVSQTIEPFSYEFGARDEITYDLGTDVESTRTERRARGTYDERHFDDRLSTTLSVFVTERETLLDVPAGSSPSVQVTPVQGFSDVDLTPQISNLTANPALIDFNTAAPSGVDIGGFATGGQLFWNMAVELPPGGAVDFVQLKTAAPVPANFVNQFSFSVWSSTDNTFWTPVQNSAAFVYDTVNQHFRLTIPRVTARYLKIVNTASPAAAPSVLVTELEILRAAGSGSSTRSRSEEQLQSGTATLSWRVSDTLSVGYDLLAQSADADSDGTTTRDETRLDNGVWGAWTPRREFSANLRAAVQRVEDDILNDEQLVNLIGVLTYRPLETLDIDLSYNDTSREVDGDDDVQTHVAQILTTAQLLPTLRGELVFERNQLEDFTNSRDISRWISSAALVAELTRQVEWTLRARNDDAEVTGLGAAGIPDPSEERYESTLLYRPTEQFIAEYELEWIDGSAGDGLDQRLRLDWIPFADGAIDLQLDFDRTRTESFSDTQVDRYRGRARYSLDSHTYLEFQYAQEQPDTGPSTELLLLSFHFNA